jgi:hypothetical protein
MFAAKTGKTIQAIIKAKRQLEEMGLLVVLERGGGSKKGRYMLDLYYDDEEKSIKASRIRQEEQLSEEQQETPGSVETPAADEPIISEQLQPEIEAPIYEAGTAQPQLGAEAQPVEQRKLPAREGCVPAEENPDPDPPVSQPQISDTPEAKSPSRIEGCESHTTKLSLPPPVEVSSINIYNKNKQNTNPEDEKTKAERRKATAAVCFLFRSWGIQLEPNDYAFIGWCFKHYGVEAVNEKIQIMKFQRHRGVEFSNPLGWLRSALMNDYGFSKWDIDVIKAKERARRAAELSRLEQMRRDRERQNLECLKQEAEAIKAQFTPEDRAALRKKALDQILSMEGMTEEWINEPLVRSVENRILREGTFG